MARASSGVSAWIPLKQALSRPMCASVAPMMNNGSLAWTCSALTTTQRYMHLSPAHKDAAIRLLDRRPVDDREDAPAPADDNISRFKTAASNAAPAPFGVKTVGDGLETSLRPEP